MKQMGIMDPNPIQLRDIIYQLQFFISVIRITMEVWKTVNGKRWPEMTIMGHLLDDMNFLYLIMNLISMISALFSNICIELIRHY